MTLLEVFKSTTSSSGATNYTYTWVAPPAKAKAKTNWYKWAFFTYVVMYWIMLFDHHWAYLTSAGLVIK